MKTVRAKSNLNQWKNTDAVLNWFKDIPNKNRFTFIIFDICDFYPSISPALLTKAINYAKNYVNISDDDLKIILQARKSFLFDQNIPWNKSNNSEFDVGMGSYDGAECCEIVGLYLMKKLQHLNINVGVYRDDALGVSLMTPRQNDLLMKKICQIFREENLSITISVNKKVVDFLDVNLDLNTGVFKPFMKENDTPTYVNMKSNHPPCITKNIPASVNRRLSSISGNEGVFKEAIPPYQEALMKSGYAHQLQFALPTQQNSGKRNRSRKLTYFNPPFSLNVSSNVGQQFLKLIDTCFPKTHPLAKILNRNTVKISYRCMPNMGQVIARHNCKIVKQDQGPQTPPGCNCRGGPSKCPVDGACLTEGVVYRATVTRGDNSAQETYTGLTARKFKQRLYEHTQDFNNENREGTGLSNFIWKLKNDNITYKINWKILMRSQSFNPSTKLCSLCLKEKYCIMFLPEGASLNSRSEFFSTCRHRLKPLLGNLV